MIVDAHQHFWQLSRGDYRWMTPDLQAIYRDFMPADLVGMARDLGVRRSVLVQAADSVAETRFLLELAAAEPFIAGVVGWVDMAGDLGALRALAQHDKLLGIRPMIQDIEDPQWMLRAELAPCFELLLELGQRFDALVKPWHLGPLLELCRRYPELPIVIDHGAKPQIAAGGDMEAWKRGLEDLVAARPDLYCKLSGLWTEAAPGAEAESLRPYMDALAEVFGPTRLMWGSDWPVLLLNGDYASWLGLVQDWVSGFAETARQDIMANNALTFYGIEA